jgi:colicin import membrane protein
MPAPAPPPAKAIIGEAERQAAAEKRRQLLLRQKQEAEREAAQRAKMAKQTAENGKRQAEQREAQRAAAAKRAALSPASSPAAGAGQLRSPTAGSASPAAIGAYRGEVMGHLAGFKRYPESARARGAQGRPSIAFTLDASGHVASVSLTHSSGQPDIDAEAVAMVRRASPFPAPPAGASRSFTATIGFVLH